MSLPGAIRTFFDVRREERGIAAAMSTCFFLVITSFWILKPLKKILFINHYANSGFDLLGRSYSASETELLAKVMNMFVAAAAAWAFARLSRRFRRDRLTSVCMLFLLAGYALFALALASPRPAATAVWAFYLFGDLFNTLMVAAFFSFLNDSVSSDGAKRLYGIVGFGGVAGGVFGSTAVGALIGSLSIAEWLGITSALGFAILAVARAAARSLDLAARENRAASSQSGPGAESSATRSPSEPPLPALGSAPASGAVPNAPSPPIGGIELVFRSDYLLSIVAIVGLYELVSTLVDFQFTTSIAEFSAGEAERNRAFAAVYATTNWLSMFVQLFLTSFVMRRFGLQTALLVLPCSIALASLAFAARPSLILGGGLSVADNAFSYSINQSAKEALYVPTTVAEKYQAKAFIDMFVQRFAKALGVGLGLIASAWFGGVDGVRKLSFFVLPALLLWAFAAAHAGRRFAQLEARPPKQESRDA